MIVGYARVSTEEQNLSLQLQALQQLGCHRVYSDQGVSGSQASRPGLDQALGCLRAGDKLAVWRLDRLGRSLVQLVHLLEALGRREVLFHSVCESIDTSSCGGRLVFHMMGALAEFERGLISERTLAGLAAARAAGKLLGRPALLSHEQVCWAREQLAQARWSEHELALHFGVHLRTLRRGLGRSCQPQG